MEYEGFVISNTAGLQQLWKFYVFDNSCSFMEYTKNQIFYKTGKYLIDNGYNFMHDQWFTICTNYNVEIINAST